MVFQASASEKAMAADLLAPASKSSETAKPSRVLHIQTKAHYQREMRDELLGKHTETSKNLRNFSVVYFCGFHGISRAILCVRFYK